MVPRSLWRDLNVLIAAFAMCVAFGGFALYARLAALLSLVLPASKVEVFALPAGYALFAVLLAWYWRRHGLSPRQIAPGREWRYRTGHVLLVAGNAGAAIAMLQAQAGQWLVTQKAMLPIVKSSFVLVLFAPFAMAAGLWLVFTARATRATDPASADAVPDRAQEQEPERTSGPRWAAVLAGIVVSGWLAFVGAVFGALSFQHRPDRYVSLVVPILGGGFVLYTATALRLAGAGRGTAAVRVAWAPPVLLMGGAILFNVVAMLAMSLFGR